VHRRGFATGIFKVNRTGFALGDNIFQTYIDVDQSRRADKIGHDMFMKRA